MNTQRKSTQKGFTLIELMITVAIVGILAAVAVPAYQDYVAKSQAAEAISLADGLKANVLDYLTSKGACPSNAAAGDAPGIPEKANIKGTYVDNVATGGTAPNCTIIATFRSTGTINDNLKSKTVTMTAAASDTSGTYNWTCTSNALQRYLPHACTGGT